MEEVVKKAIEIFMEIYNKAGEKNIKGEFGASLRARARNAPLLTATRGLLPYILFLASKASEDNWKISLDNINFDKNKGGYQAQLYAIAKFLQEEDVITLPNFDTKELLLELKVMGENSPEKYLLAEELVQSFTEQFKRLAEALLPDKKKEGEAS